MANKNLDVTLQVKLAGVQDAERKLKDLQKELTRINATYFSKKAFFKDIDVKVNVNLGNVKQTQQQLQQAFQNTTVNVPTQTVGETANTSTPQSGQNFDWKTAIQFTKMKALTPAALMQTASRITSLSTAFSGLIGVLTAVSVRTAFSTFTKYTRSVSGALGELKNVILSLTGMDKMFSVQGITNSMIALADVTKEIKKQSLQTGIAVDALSQYRFAMKQVGVSAENFGSNISYMGKAIVQAATGVSVDAGNAFKKLKLDPKELRLKDTQTQFEEIAKAIAQLPSETDKASAALLIFNRSGSQLLPFINKFSEGLKQSEGVLGQLPRLMKLYSSEFTQFSNNISNLQVKGQQFIGGFMTQMVPSLNSYLQEFLKVDFTDFGKMFADNFQRTIASLNVHDDIGALLNSFTLDLMDVVDQTLQKTVDYAVEALMKIEWDVIAGKILKGTYNYTEKVIEKGWEGLVGTVANFGTIQSYKDKNEQASYTKMAMNNFKSLLRENGVEDEEIIEETVNKVILKELERKYVDDHDKIKELYKEGAAQKALSEEDSETNRIIQGEFIKLSNSLTELDKLYGQYVDQFGEEAYNKFEHDFYEKIVKDETLNNIDVNAKYLDIVNKYKDSPELVAKEQEFINSEILKKADSLALDRDLQRSLMKAIEEAFKNAENTAKNEASANLTQASAALKDTVSRLDAELLDLNREHNEFQKSAKYSDSEKLDNNLKYIENRSSNLKERFDAYMQAGEALKQSEEILRNDEEWISFSKNVIENIKKINEEIQNLDSEQRIAVTNNFAKQLSIQAEEADRKIRTLKTSIDTLKSKPIAGVADIKAIGGAYRDYATELNNQKSKTETDLRYYKAFGFDENSEVVKKATERLEKFNTALEQATNEAEQWAQSVIVEGVQETVTQRNTELGQFEFEQLPEWAATNKQRYDYQMQVFDAQIQASEDNIEAIRKAQEQMLELDPAVQAVRKAMNELSRDTEDYDEKFAGLLNDLEQARSNSNVRRSAGYRQLEQMRGQEQTKGMMAQSRKQKQENPESFGHQMSKSISNASDQMGTLQENVGQGFGNMIMSVRDSLSTLVSDLLSGTMTIGQAFQKMGQMILQSLISTFGQIVANFVMQQTVMRLLQLMFNAELAAQAAALTTMWTTPATLASIASWGGAATAGSAAVISALALTKSATAGMSAMAKGGRIKGKEQIIRVNEEGEEFIVSAKSPLANEKYLKLANLGYNLDSLFANQSMKEVNASASKLNIINNSKTERPQTNNNINIGMINSRQDKRRWMRKEGQRMIVDFLNGHRGALKYA